ncbi:hypothetical protein ACFQJ5_14470 [Halomicroarcula sp. GCM10025324]|uniref:DUF7261 family protein n=1 Tax=Haloarcula TaxID=2237 RepID=UPI0023E78403|nr:hypothetical protein [Halomicroarcula sp. ZS-22-S1]
MANLRRADRGQIILIAAFALAVTFVALALIVNSAIFTENLASRGETGGSDDALEVRAMAEASVGEAIFAANVHNTSTTTTLENGVKAGIGETTDQLELQHVTGGALVEVRLVPGSPVYGSRIVQNESGGRTFEDNDLSGDGEWQVVTRLERDSDQHNATRAFKMNVSTLPDSGDAFVVTANGTRGEPTWEMRLYSASDGDVDAGEDVIVEVTTPSGSESCTHQAEHPYVHVDVTGGTVAGEPCDALRQGLTDVDGFFDGRFAHGVGDERYNITYENGGEVVGNYSLVTRSTGTNPTPNLNTTVGLSPYATDAIYSLSVQFTYETSEVQYDTRIRVAPGEPDA